MKHLTPAFLALTLALSSASAYAGASDVTFTPEEIAANAMNAAKISETGAACLARHWETHTAFHKQRGYSKYYGNRNPKYKTPELRRNAILALLPELAKKVRKNDPAAIAELNTRERELENISCIGLALTCLGEGFKSAGMDATWEKIWNWIGRPGPDGSPLFYGTDLQKALVDLGWKSIYWNPDLSQNEEWDYLERAFNPLQEGKEWNPVWGGHVQRWNSVLKKRSYFGVPVHDIRTLVNFGVTPGAEFKTVPFFVGTAHAGYHVFPGMKGNVIEAHSMRELKSRENLEVGPFNPLYQPVNGVQGGNGAPRWTRSEHYRSGVIVVPPGFLAEKPYTVPAAAVNTPPNGTIPPEQQPGWEDPRDPWRQPEPPRRRRDCFFIFCR
jgi:hypothetical protein